MASASGTSLGAVHDMMQSVSIMTNRFISEFRKENN